MLNQNETLISLLIKQGALVNKANQTGKTPLFIAAQEGHIAVVKALLAQDAAVNQARQDGATPFHIAKQKGFKDIVKWLGGPSAISSLKDYIEANCIFRRIPITHSD